MINIHRISRVYKSDDAPVYALKDVSLSLPSKGMIFVVGKSGSGKSTLLNIIAGFDKPTKGDIYYGDINLNKLNPRELDYYRNSEIGFVFQDYCLIDTFTVKQNINVAFDFKNEKSSKEKIDEILTSVGMKGYEKRYPRQLSAGQKQRIAIARALAKDSKIILADEPTGNLDSKTTEQILDLLKIISKDRLVIIVSHSKEDAFKYADRIIEISNGEIINDRIKNDEFENKFSIEENTISLPNKKRLTALELDKINTLIKEKEGNVTFVRSKEKFTAYKQKHEAFKIKLKQTKMGFKNLFKYSWLFFKNQLFSFFLVVFIVTLLITTLSLSLQFGNFDGQRQFEDAVHTTTSNTLVVRQEANIERETSLSNPIYMGEFTQDKKEKLEKEFNCKSYDIYNYYSPFGTATYRYYYSSYLTGMNINTLLVCDEEYLAKVFGDESGNLKYWGDISSSADGIIITDIFADYILKAMTSYKVYSYEDIINSNEFYKKTGTKIAGIIDGPGDYASYKDGSFAKNFETEEDYYDTITRDYGIFYTTNPNYYEKYIQDLIKQSDSFIVAHQQFKTEDGVNEYNVHGSSINFTNANVKENEIILTYTIYNELFGTSCSSTNLADFEKKDIIYRAYDVNSNTLVEKTLTIRSLSSYNYLNPCHLENLVQNQFKRVGAYYVEVQDLGRFFTTADTLGVNIITSSVTIVETVVECIAIFTDLFKMLSIIMIISILVLIIVNTVNIMNRNIYNIGVSRSLGAHTSELGFIFALQMLMFGVFVIIFSIISDFLSIKLINKLLADTIPNVVQMPGVENITYLYFDPTLSASLTSMIVILTILSICAPILAIRLMNPVNIIKKKA